jgi:hypothetical protein
MDKNKSKRTEYTNTDDEFLRNLLAAFSIAVQTRGAAGTFGEISLKLTQKNGKIEGGKILEEAILKPGDTPGGN